MSRVRYESDPKCEVKDMPGWIETTLLDGRRLVHEVPQVRGDERHRVRLDELLKNFCANTACLGPDGSERLAGHILGLDAAARLDGLASCLRAVGPSK